MKKVKLTHVSEDEEVKIDKEEIENVKNKIDKMRSANFSSITKRSKGKRLSMDGGIRKKEVVDILGDIAIDVYNESDIYVGAGVHVKVLQFYINDRFNITKSVLESVINTGYVEEIVLYVTDTEGDTLTLEVHLSDGESLKNFYMIQDLEKIDDIKFFIGEGVNASKGTKILVNKIADIFTLDLKKRPEFPAGRDETQHKARFFLSGSVKLSQIKKFLSDRTFSDFHFKHNLQQNVFYVEVTVPAIGDFKDGFSL